MNRVENAGNFSKKKIMVNSFLGGIFWGAGSIIGAAIIIVIFGFIVTQVNVIPVVGDFVANIATYVESQKLEAPNPFNNAENN